MDVGYLCAGIAVADYGAAVAWYERFFGRPPDVLPHATEAMWLLEGAGGVYIVEDSERAGGSLAALLVRNLDSLAAELASRDIAFERLDETDPRRVVVTDPYGNRITVGELPS